jgi:hypothetical protein
MTRILAIDPGSTESGWVVIDAYTRQPLRFGKTTNDLLLAELRRGEILSDVRHVAVERIASYGMAVGAEVFDTCMVIGRLQEALRHCAPRLVYRREVKLHHCASPKANDSNITQALVDRFAYGQPNRGKGTKKQPGWFYGFAKDVWQAYAIAVLVADDEGYERKATA